MSTFRSRNYSIKYILSYSLTQVKYNAYRRWTILVSNIICTFYIISFFSNGCKAKLFTDFSAQCNLVNHLCSFMICVYKMSSFIEYLHVPQRLICMFVIYEYVIVIPLGYCCSTFIWQTHILENGRSEPLLRHKGK